MQSQAIDDLEQGGSRTRAGGDQAPGKPCGRPAEAQIPPESSTHDTAGDRGASVRNQVVGTGATSLPVFRVEAPVTPKTFTDSTPTPASSPVHPHTGAENHDALTALLSPRPSGAAQEIDFLTQLAERIQTQLRDGENIIRIQLKPSSLGRMEIKAETTSAGVVATIIAESAGVKSFLEHNLHTLQQSMQDQGLKVERIDITIQNGEWTHSSASGQRESGPGAENRGGSGPRYWHRISEGYSEEELPVDSVSLAALSPHSTFHTIA